MKIIIKIFKIITGIFSCIMAFASLSLAFTKTPVTPFIVEASIFGALAFFLLKKPKKVTMHKQQNNLSTDNYTDNNQDIRQPSNNDMLNHAVFPHVSGLPIAENVMCKLCSYPDRIEFMSGSANITLARNKITDICVKSETEIQKQMVSNPGGAIAGAMMFGAVGAIIGGKPKTKKQKTTSFYLIITYVKSQNELSYIVLNATGSFSAHKFVKEFHALNSNSTAQVEL